jgi:ketosteroid isomerase-like protein
MSEHPNAATIRRGYEAFVTYDLEAIRDLFTEDVVFHIGGRSPLAGTYSGKDAVLGFLADLTSRSGGTYKADVHDILASDEHVVVLTKETAQREGRSLADNLVAVYHMRDGRAAEGWFHPGDAYADDEFWS